jgi:hypothetical protein
MYFHPLLFRQEMTREKSEESPAVQYSDSESQVHPQDIMHQLY